PRLDIVVDHVTELWNARVATKIPSVIFQTREELRAHESLVGYLRLYPAVGARIHLLQAKSLCITMVLRNWKKQIKEVAVRSINLSEVHCREQAWCRNEKSIWKGNSKVEEVARGRNKT